MKTKNSVEWETDTIRFSRVVKRMAEDSEREYHLKLARQLSLPNLEAKFRQTIDNPK